MIFVTIVCLCLFGLGCNYLGYKKGLKEGIEMTKRDYNSKLNDHIEEAFKKEAEKLTERFDKFLKENPNEKSVS